MQTVIQRIQRCLILPLVFILCSFHSIESQPNSISFEHFTHEDGLSAPVQIIKEDTYGFIWLGTTDGLNRFDGKNFVVYRNIPNDPHSLPNNIINDLCVDSEGKIWAATNGGLCYYNYEDDAFHSVAFPDSLEPLDRYRVHAVTTDSKNNVWFASRTHLHKWRDGAVQETVPFPDTINLNILNLFCDGKDRVWLGINYGLYLYDPATRQTILTKLESPFTKERNLIATVGPFTPTHPDTMLIGSWYGGLQKIYMQGDLIRNIPYTDETQTDTRKHIVRGICHYTTHQFWIGTYGNGLSIFDLRSASFIAHYKHDPANAKSLSNNFVNDVFMDRAGILWVATDAGLDKFDPFTQQFQSISLPPFEGEFAVYRTPSSFLEDLRDPDILWVTVSGSGIYEYHTKTRALRLHRHDPNRKSSLPDNAVTALFRDRQGRHWVGMRSGLSLADDSFENFYVPDIFKPGTSAGINKIIQNPDDSFWFKTGSNGFFHWNEKTKTLTPFVHDPENPNSLRDNRVFSMIPDHAGNLWVGTQNRGLCRLDPKTGTFIFFERDKNKAGTLPDNGIYDLYEDEHHRLWIATENGFAEMDIKDFSIRVYTTADGLCNNDVFSITPDTAGFLWLATNNGLSKFDPKRKTFKNYFIPDGLPTNRLSGGTYMSRDGTFYLGTPGTISYCRPSMMQINKRIPPVIITGFKVFDREQPVMRNGPDMEPIRLSYKENMITFDFAALNFTNSDLNQYAYRLEGFDDQWIYCGNTQSATFTNLDGGTYTFHVKAANNDGVWNETGAKVTITVKPPYWETWWFYLLCLLAGGGILFVAYRFRIQQLMQLQQIRMRISRDLHDDIGSTLSSINMISTMAHERSPVERKSNELFQTISHASSQAMELMNDIVWSINPKNDRMEMILIRMRQYASEMLEAAQIPFTLEMDESCQHLLLPIEKRKDFYLIFKEAINNLAKYSKARKAEIRMTFANRLLRLHIADDGVGFDPLTLQSGNGVKNMKARALQLKGEIRIESTPGVGTHIELKIPVIP